jgi:hypothetical protein
VDVVRCELCLYTSLEEVNDAALLDAEDGRQMLRRCWRTAPAHQAMSLPTWL